MTWDENLLQFQRNYGGTLLGSVASYQPCGLLHTRYQGVDLTIFLTFVQDGKGMAPWSAAAAPAELERPYSLTVKHRNKLVPQGLMADFERCSTGREELDDALVKGWIWESYQLIASKLPKAIRTKYLSGMPGCKE